MGAVAALLAAPLSAQCPQPKANKAGHAGPLM
jgi:hypothetical protein